MQLFLAVILLPFFTLQAQQPNLAAAGFHANNRLYTITPVSSCPSGEGVDVAGVVSAYKTRLATAGVTMTAGQESAFQTFVQGLSDSCMYSSLTEIYTPFWNNATANLLGFKNAFNLTTPNGATHTATGMDWNGSNQYAATGIIQATHLSMDSMHMAYYAGETGATATLMGANATAGTVYNLLIPDYFGDGSLRGWSISRDLNTYTTSSPAQGFHLASRYSNSAGAYYRNGTLIHSTTFTAVAAVDREVYLGGRNNGSGGNQFSSIEMRYASIGWGIPPSKAPYYATLVNNLLTAFGINTY